MLEVNIHDDSSDQPAASWSVYYGRSAALVGLILNREASKQLASPGDNPTYAHKSTSDQVHSDFVCVYGNTIDEGAKPKAC